MHFERHLAFQNAENYIFFPGKDNKKKWLPNLKFSDLLPKTHIFFYWPSLFIDLYLLYFTG